MGRCIIKLNDCNVDWYLEWSTVVDAPVTYGMSLEEMKRYRLEKTGTDGMRDWEEVVERVNRTGSSWHDAHYKSVYDTIRFNRAGVGETCLTAGQILSMYCYRTGDIKGHEHSEDDELADCDGKGTWR